MSHASSATAYSTFFLFATAMATGIPFVLPLVPLERIGRRFFILMSLIALCFVALAVVAGGLGISSFHLAFASLLILYNVCVPKQPGLDRTPRARETPEPPRLARAVARAALLGAAIAGGAALVADALAFPHDLRLPGARSAWLVASFLSAAWLLGAALVAMVLGHWYLVARGLSFTPLRRLTGVLALALGVRLAVVGAAAAAQHELWGERLAEASLASFLAADGVFVLARVLFGLAAPLVLVKLVWNCVQVKSNQSATGILYVVVAFVLIGELSAKHLLVVWGSLM